MGGWGDPFFSSQVEEREKMLAGLEKTTSDLDTRRRKAQKDVSGLATCDCTVLVSA